MALPIPYRALPGRMPLITVGPNPPTSAVWGPASRGLAGALGSGRPTLSGTPITPLGPAETPVSIRGLTGAAAGAADDVAGAAARGGIRGLAGQALQGIRAGGWRGAARASIPGLVGSIGGNLIDESDWFGGRDSVVNDTLGKVGKWGGAGAAIGSILPGVGTAAGAGVGALVGVGHEALERFGILGSDPAEVQNAALTEAQRIASETNLHPNALAELNRQYETLLSIAGDDQTQRDQAAQAYLEQVTQAALAQAQDPTVFMSRQERLDAAPAGPVDPALLGPEHIAAQEQASNMAIQAAMADLWQPFAVEYMARNDAAVQALRNASAGTGAMQPVLEAQAAELATRAPRDLAHMLGRMQAAPYMEALQAQSAALKQQAQSMQAQAMGAIQSGAWDQFMQWQAQGGASGGGGGDLSAALTELGL